MKKEEQTWVDDHFRRHEADIPVTFDPKHWEQLTAALDHATRPGTPISPPSSSPTAGNKPFGKIKGWWVSGVWVLLFLSSAWVLWQRTQVAEPVPPAIDSTSETPQATPAPPVPAPPPVPSVSGAAEKPGSTQSAHGAMETTREIPAENPVHSTPAPKSEIPPAADSLRMLQPAPADSPPDTLSAGKRKKKHLFW